MADNTEQTAASDQAAEATPDAKHNNIWANIIDEVKKQSSIYIATRNSTDQSLYQLLQTTYKFRQQAEKDKKEFYKFTKNYYDKNGLGKVGNDIYTAILKISFESEYKDEKTKDNTAAKISSYSTALKFLESEKTDELKNSETAVIDAINEMGGIQDIVKAARAKKKEAVADKYQLVMDTDEQIVIRNKPIHTFSYPKQGSGFRLALIHIDDKGNASILNERQGIDDAEVKAALARSAKERYTRLSIPYIGNKNRYLRMLDKWLQTPMDEYREPFVGSGAVFLFVKSKRPDDKIDYWLNDADPIVMNWWKQVQKDPEPLIKGHERHIKKAGGDKDEAKKIVATLKPELKSDDILKSSIAYITLKCWAFNWRDDYTVSNFNLNNVNIPKMNINIRRTHELLDGVKLTCDDFAKVIKAAPSKPGGKVLIFNDEPYEDHEHLYRCIENEFKPDDTAEIKKQKMTELHWRITTTLGHCGHKWILTHSDTKLFRSRSVFAALCQPDNGFKFKTVPVFTGFKNIDQTEAITSNYDPDTGTKASAIGAELDKAIQNIRKQEETAQVTPKPIHE